MSDDELKGKLKDAKDRAVQAVGGLSVLARALDVTPQAVNLWKQVPAKRVLDVERITGIPRYELRPDIFYRPRSLSNPERAQS